MRGAATRRARPAFSSHSSMITPERRRGWRAVHGAVPPSTAERCAWLMAACVACLPASRPTPAGGGRQPRIAAWDAPRQGADLYTGCGPFSTVDGRTWCVALSLPTPIPRRVLKYRALTWSNTQLGSMRELSLSGREGSHSAATIYRHAHTADINATLTSPSLARCHRAGHLRPRGTCRRVQLEPLAQFRRARPKPLPKCR